MHRLLLDLGTDLYFDLSLFLLVGGAALIWLRPELRDYTLKFLGFALPVLMGHWGHWHGADRLESGADAHNAQPPA